jgi:hypothetical protein
MNLEISDDAIAKDARSFSDMSSKARTGGGRPVEGCSFSILARSCDELLFTAVGEAIAGICHPQADVGDENCKTGEYYYSRRRASDVRCWAASWSCARPSTLSIYAPWNASRDRSEPLVEPIIAGSRS